MSLDSSVSASNSPVSTTSVVRRWAKQALTVCVGLASLLPLNAAQAGGIGALVTAGIRGEPVYYYNAANCPSTALCEQHRQMQASPNLGAGLEFMLGDRDDRVTGVFRGYWLMDFAQKNPADGKIEISAGDVIATVRETPRHIGMGTVGIQVGIIGDPEKFRMTGVVHIGAGFLTTDHTEFLSAQVGPGIAVRTTRSTELFGELTYSLRYRKGFTHGGNATVGFRFLFD